MDKTQITEYLSLVLMKVFSVNPSSKVNIEVLFINLVMGDRAFKANHIVQIP